MSTAKLKMAPRFSWLVLLTSICSLCSSARILAIIPSPSFSHQVVFRPLWRELASRGHDLTLITTDPQNDPSLNITEIDISFAYDLWEQYQFVKLLEDYKFNPWKLMEMLWRTSMDTCEKELSHPEVRSLLRNESEHFDLVMVEYIYPVMLGFSERFKCPYIGLTTFELPSVFYSVLRNEDHPIAFPDVFLPFDGHLRFSERVVSLVFSSMAYIKISFNIYIDFDRHRKYFGENIPPLIEIMKKFSVMFVNVDPAFSVRPLGPAFVRIGGGAHLNPLKPLPQDLQQYLDGAKDGVVYVSLGTNVKSSRVPLEMRKIMLNTFKELPYKVLWKFDVADSSYLSNNIKIVNWLPQQDILRHPNVKAFVTQGGLQSMEEAIFSNIPLVGIPFVADQDANVQKMVKKGFGIHLNKDKLSKEYLTEAILEVIRNPKYKKKTIEIAELSKDQPMTGLEKAVWWTEYVLRHNGAPNLKDPIMELPFYQYYLLDVIGLVLAVILVSLYVGMKIFIFLKNIFSRLLWTDVSTKLKKH